MLHEFLVDWESDRMEQSIPERFEKIVGRYPERLAAKTRDRSLSYRELNEASNRIANALLTQRGPGNDSVALLCEHGVDVIAGMLGALKGGKLFCVLDAHLPEERISYILDDIQARLILTNSRNFALAHRVATDARAVLNIDDIKTSSSVDNPELSISSNAAAFVVYTSGSTGSPRGVLREHQKTVANAIRAGSARGLRIHDRLSLVHTVSFAAGEADLYMSLLNGAAVCLFDIKSEGIQRLPKWLKEEQITIFHSAPALFRDFATLPFTADEFPSLRLIRLSGAPITQLDFELYKSKFSTGTFLEFGMGSTEAGGICAAIVDRKFSFPSEGSPVGRARQGKEILILDDNGHQVDPGQVGEIAVKSRNLNPGYWKKPELTMSKFLGEPSENAERLYLTGDLGRMLPDGMVILLGRKDHMIKIRGYRVDISEVERALLEHPVIRDAGVAAWDREPGEKYLAGYVVPREESAPNVSELKEFLRNKLPDYMLPATFVFLKSLPLTNGKLNRRALPLPDHKRPNVGQPYVPAQNVTEQKLIQMWEELLDVFPIGIHDNFFDLGGHSLLGSRFVSRLHQAFHVELPLRSVFDFPTVASLAEWVETTRGEPQDVRTLPIVSVLREAELPLSFSQQRLWFLDQLEPESCAYNLRSVFQLTGRLNVTALQQSFNEIIKRHEALRTVFKSVNGRPLQMILPSMIIDVPIVDLQKMSSAMDRDSQIRHLCAAEAQRPFDLASGPLLRVALMRLSENEHLLLLTLHHIVFDGWSVGILARELSALYEAYSNGQPSPLPELSIQYADFSHWQREWLQGKVIEEQIAYWKKQLKGLPTLELPTNRPRPPAQTLRGARQSFVLSKELSAALKRLSNQHGVTLFMTLLAAYQTLLHRYTGQNDIMIGSPVAGRSRRELEHLIGFFLNMLVLRTDLSGNPTFRELLARVRGICLDAYEHQDLPFEKLVEELSPQRTMSHTPLFQTSFALQNTPTFPLKLTGLAVEEADIGSGKAIFDLHLYVLEEQGGLRGWLSYNADLFEAATITRMVRHLQLLLEGIVANPDQKISALLLLTQAEKHQLLIEWNDTKTDYPKDKCIHELFETQVEKTPDAIALVFKDQQWTYDELNNRANQLAHYLQKLGVGPDVLVGLCMERSMEMIVGLLGILKAGGAYVPLDPAYPKERLAFMLEDAHTAVLITQKRLIDTLPISGAILVCLDEDRGSIARESTENLASRVTAKNLAYVIYTSGSTGRPKGVLVTQQNLVHSISARMTYYREPVTSYLLLSSLAFDSSVAGIFWTLCRGGALLLPKERAQRDLAYLIELLSNKHTSHLLSIPSLYALLLRQAEPRQLVGLRTVILAGEPCPSELVACHGELLPRVSLFNEYGPTEGTVWSTVYDCRFQGLVTSVPIGRPIANTQIYILDDHQRPVPAGIAGELHIGGDGVARGYLDYSELTAEKFIPDPFSEKPGVRLYKTGDLGRYLPDGNIEFLGRIDNQVKIRGFRIELGEIESVLRQHPMVGEVVVLAREDNPGEKRLAAYVVAAPDSTPSANELRSVLQEKLPDYMVPSVFMFLDSLPLTPNGKVDRKALPAPDQSRPELAETYTAPRTRVEQLLAQIWSDVLKLDKVGIHDNFFELGGHSLLATQVMSRIRDAFQMDIPLRTLFDKPTVEELAIAMMHHSYERISEEELSGILNDLESLSEDELKQPLV
jgi:amino acid adenylation domain-containing protein